MILKWNFFHKAPSYTIGKTFCTNLIELKFQWLWYKFAMTLMELRYLVFLFIQNVFSFVQFCFVLFYLLFRVSLILRKCYFCQFDRFLSSLTMLKALIIFDFGTDFLPAHSIVVISKDLFDYDRFQRFKGLSLYTKDPLRKPLVVYFKLSQDNKLW